MPSFTSVATSNDALDRRPVEEILSSIATILVAYRADVQGTIRSLDSGDQNQANLIVALRALRTKLDGTLDIINDFSSQANVSSNDAPVRPRPKRPKRIVFADVTNTS